MQKIKLYQSLGVSHELSSTKRKLPFYIIYIQFYYTAGVRKVGHRPTYKAVFSICIAHIKKLKFLASPVQKLWRGSQNLKVGHVTLTTPLRGHSSPIG